MTANLERFLCVVGGQRSGTTALESALAASTLFHDFSEIFQIAELREPGNFYDFAAERRVLATDLASFTGILQVMDDYFGHLEHLAGRKLPLLDIKFNAWNAIRPFWGFMSEEPLLMKEMRRRGTRFIFIVRRDLAAQIMSEWIAREAGQWHLLQEDHPIAPFEIKKSAALRRARLIIEAEKRIYGFLKDSDHLFAVYYEDLYQNGAVSSRLSQWLQAQFPITLNGPLVPNLVPNKVPKRAVIANAEEIQSAVAKLIANLGRVEF
jgi:hypothetical protein